MRPAHARQRADHRSRWAILVACLLAIATMAAPAAQASVVPPDPDQAAHGLTPEPRRTPRPERTPQPGLRTPGPAEPTEPSGPEDRDLTIGYVDPSVAGRAALLLADARGYFRDAGFEAVSWVESGAPLPGLLNGDLDFAVLDSVEAASGNALGLPIRAIAGHRNYRPSTDPAAPAAYGGDLIGAADDTVQERPRTVEAFLAAYLRALTALRTEDPDATLEAIGAAGVTVTDQDRAAWSGMLDAFAPLDGGFGQPSDGGGLGELRAYLAEVGQPVPDLAAFLAVDGLATTQAAAEIARNPLAPPTRTEVRIGYPSAAFEDRAVLLWAQGHGAFERWGLEATLVETPDPVAAVVQGDVDLAIADKLAAAAASAAGDPLLAIASHANRTAQGAYGGDLVAANGDFVALDPSTITAFAGAFAGSLQQLRDPTTADELFALAAAAGAPATPDEQAAWPDTLARLAPFDGGYGSPDQGGGLGELEAYLAANLGAPPDLSAFVWPAPLQQAQAALGLPANPAPDALAQGTVAR